MTMTHPGLPVFWVMLIIAISFAYLLFFNVTPESKHHANVGQRFKLTTLQNVLFQPWILFFLKLIMVLFFITVIVAGLSGTSIPERNFATLMTWNLWWAGLVFSILFLGSAWCAICPWDTIAQWLVRRRFWGRASPNNSLNFRVPKYLKNVWPALFMFIGLTWLELGVGVTINPYATALLSLLMVVLATVSLALFERKAFCRNFCPVGRTIGFYSQLAPIEIRPINNDTCAECRTLECYYGTETTEPCPTWLVMGRLKQNSYCTSCGNCVQSCPHKNISWCLRAPSIEAIQTARPRFDEAWFMLILLALTAFHGITMLTIWEEAISLLARFIGDSGQLLTSFSIGLVISIFMIIAVYALLVQLTRVLNKSALSFKRSFSSLAFVSLPLAFSYHMAHNLNHLIREGGGLLAVIMNPLGHETLPLTMMEKHQRHLDLWVSQDVLFALQSLLMIFGVIIALKTIRARGLSLVTNSSHISLFVSLSPMLVFVSLITAFHCWMLMQPMIMRM